MINLGLTSFQTGTCVRTYMTAMGGKKSCALLHYSITLSKTSAISPMSSRECAFKFWDRAINISIDILAILYLNKGYSHKYRGLVGNYVFNYYESLYKINIYKDFAINIFVPEDGLRFDGTLLTNSYKRHLKKNFIPNIIQDMSKVSSVL